MRRSNLQPCRHCMAFPPSNVTGHWHPRPNVAIGSLVTAGIASHASACPGMQAPGDHAQSYVAYTACLINSNLAPHAAHLSPFALALHGRSYGSTKQDGSARGSSIWMSVPLPPRKSGRFFTLLFPPTIIPDLSRHVEPQAVNALCRSNAIDGTNVCRRLLDAYKRRCNAPLRRMYSNGPWTIQPVICD